MHRHCRSANSVVSIDNTAADLSVAAIVGAAVL